MRNHLKIAAAIGGTALIATSATAVPAGAMVVSESSASTQAPAGKDHPLTGVWTATIDPLPNPAGDQPPFESTLAYARSHVLNEITSRATSTSAGLGAWTKVGDSTYRTSWVKYRFDGTGAYIGKTVVTERITVLGKRSYEGRALTRVVDSSGAVVAQFESQVAATRLTP